LGCRRGRFSPRRSGRFRSCQGGKPLQPVTLKTERLLLRPFTKDDVLASLSYRDDEEFARFLPHIPQPFTLADAEKFVEVNMSQPWDQFPTFAIELEGQLVGTVDLQVDARERIAMIGYAIGRSHWGKGITTEGAQVVIAWAFETFRLAKIWASADPENFASRRVMEKLGMTQEGTLRGHALGRQGERRDEVVYGVLREEWLNRV